MTAYTLPLHTQALVQAERAGPSGPKASGVKVEWPRLGTRRGAQPANPTAARRGALDLLRAIPQGQVPNLGLISAPTQRIEIFVRR